MDLLLNFPKDYPLNPLSVVVADDQDIPPECISSLNSAIMESPVTRHSSGSLMLRPFLHWLDRVITMLVMESLPDDYDDDDFIHFFIDVTYNILNAVEVQFGIYPAEENVRYITFKKCRRLSCGHFLTHFGQISDKPFGQC